MRKAIPEPERVPTRGGRGTANGREGWEEPPTRPEATSSSLEDGRAAFNFWTMHAASSLETRGGSNSPETPLRATLTGILDLKGLESTKEAGPSSPEPTTSSETPDEGVSDTSFLDAISQIII